MDDKNICFVCGNVKEDYESAYCDKCWQEEEERLNGKEVECMNVKELSKGQLIELKQRYYTEKNENVSWGELADIDELVSDNEIFKEYEGICFVEDDFFTKEPKIEVGNSCYINDDTTQLLLIVAVDGEQVEVKNLKTGEEKQVNVKNITEVIGN